MNETHSSIKVDRLFSWHLNSKANTLRMSATCAELSHWQLDSLPYLGSSCGLNLLFITNIMILHLVVKCMRKKYVHLLYNITCVYQHDVVYSQLAPPKSISFKPPLSHKETNHLRGIWADDANLITSQSLDRCTVVDPSTHTTHGTAIFTYMNG